MPNGKKPNIGDVFLLFKKSVHNKDKKTFAN